MFSYVLDNPSTSILVLDSPLNEPRREKRSSGFTTRSDTNRPVQSQKMARSLKFWIEVEKGLCYPSCENKCADQLRFVEAGLCFCIGKNPVFL